MQNLESLQVLAEKFGRLEGVGKKTALRMAYSVLGFTEDEAKDFATAILDAKQKIHLCPICQNLTDRELCPVCEDPKRDRSTICVVADPRAVLSLEKVKEYRGLYHVLHGVISPINGVTPEMIRIKELLTRVREDEKGEIKEIIIATNPTVEGEATAMYLARLLKPFDLRISRLAYGVPVGSDLEYADEVTLYRAIEGRRIY